MRLADILARKGDGVLCVGPDEKLLEAVAILNDNKIGGLVVRSASHVEGILTERDVLRACHDRLQELSTLLVRDVMTTELVIGKPEDTVDYAMGVMTQRRIRHLPVFEHGELTGMVSIGDLVSAKLQDADFEVRMLHDYVGGYVPWAKTG
jgi:CBS domain-containing protein